MRDAEGERERDKVTEKGEERNSKGQKVLEVYTRRETENERS